MQAIPEGINEMDSSLEIFDTMKRLKCCVIIPTYNNCKTLKRVIVGVLNYTQDIIVINDGSTDSTSEILLNYPQLIQIHLEKNKGKGNALKFGFRKAKELGFENAITIDSDGQHFPEDIPVFIKYLEKEGEILLIGSRNMAQEGIPKKSSFGNKFSNFWFWFETENRLEDTQSGFRLYPLNKIPNHFFTNKFEFEIEIIVRSAWNGTRVKNIPIQVLYDMTARVSHFRPFKDFTRISILNTVLVLIAIFYIKPRDFFRRIKKKGFKKFFLENILESQDSKLTKSLSIALGVFIGIAPFWGFQTVLVLFLAYFFRLNKVISFAFSNVSFPPFIPLIIFGSLKIGGIFMENPQNVFPNSYTDFDEIKQHLVQYLIGSFILASIMAVIFGFLGYILMTAFNSNKNKKIRNA